MTFQKALIALLGIVAGILLLLLVPILMDVIISKNYAKYSILYEHNITI
jgi:hypothetical protein